MAISRRHDDVRYGSNLDCEYAAAEEGRGVGQWLMGSFLQQTVRKASIEFYPHFHLELARYIRHCQDAQLELPYPVKQILTSPPEQYRQRDPSQQVEVAGRGKQWIPQTVSFGTFDFQNTLVS